MLCTPFPDQRRAHFTTFKSAFLPNKVNYLICKPRALLLSQSVPTSGEPWRGPSRNLGASALWVGKEGRSSGSPSDHRVGGGTSLWGSGETRKPPGQKGQRKCFAACGLARPRPGRGGVGVGAREQERAQRPSCDSMFVSNWMESWHRKN